MFQILELIYFFTILKVLIMQDKLLCAYCIKLFILGLLLWGSSWFLFEDDVLPGGYLFEMGALVVSGYSFGHTLERFTTLNPVVGMTLVGVTWRYFSSTNFLKNPIADSIDFHLRYLTQFLNIVSNESFNSMTNE